MARVLVLDDNAANRELVAAVLSHYGHTILQAICAEEGLALCRAHRPDLIISDILMPAMDGYEFVRQLRATAEIAHTKVIFYTAHYQEGEARALASACGVTHVLVKPCEPQEILRTVDEVLAGTSPATSTPLAQDFDREHLRLVTDKLSAQAEALHAANASLNALVDLNLQLASEREPRALLEKVCLGAVGLIGAKYGFVTVKDETAGGELSFVSSGLDVSSIDVANPVDIEAGPLGPVLAKGRSCRFSNRSGNLTAATLLPNLPAAHSIVAAPIISLTAAYGWLCLVDKLPADEFSAEDERILSILAAQVGRAYENGSLYEQVQKHAEHLLLEMAERERATSELQESERRFGDMLRNVRMISLMLDRQARITYCNDYLLQLTGWQREEVIGRSWFEVFVPPECANPRAVFATLIEGRPDAWHHENEILTRSGVRRVIRWNNTVLRSPEGEIIGTASIGEDTTEQKHQQERIARLSRIYAVLSGINSAIVRIHDRNQLFQEACRIAVVEGTFKMAWILTWDAGTPAAEVAASYGASDAYLTELRSVGRIDASPASLFRTHSTPTICNDVDATTAFDLERSLLLAEGIRSSGVFPLVVNGDVVAALALFATVKDFFDDEELRLLNELAGDISFGLEYIAKEEKLSYLAYYDALTGLANRTLLQERLIQYVADGTRGERQFALVVIKPERFEATSETFGRHFGDELLRQIAARMERWIGTSNATARIGPHHFAAVISDVKTEDEVARTVEEWLHHWFEEPFLIDGNELRISAKAGVAMFPSDGHDPDSLIKNADTALNKAKSSSEGLQFYEPLLSERLSERRALESKLRRALDNEEFLLHYQPKVDMETRKLKGVEALIRWHNSELGLVPPGKFIPFMEETGMIGEVGLWALREASLARSQWLEKRLNAPRVAVNVSAVQLRRKDFVRTFEQVLKLAGSEGIDIEVTESLIMDDVESNIQKLTAIRDLGVGIALDDFGTGYSSLSYLAKLPVETLKIDRSFTMAMLDDPSVMTLVSTMITLAHALKLTVVVEGIESEEQAKFLRLLRCDQMQGYLISKPLSFEDMTAYLARSRSERGSAVSGR